MSVAIITVLTIALLFLFFFSGMAIGLSMAFAGFVGFALLVNIQAALNLVAVDVFGIFSSYNYISIPLFVFMGQIAARAGIARGLYDATYRFIGHIPGGLAIGTVIAGALFKSICGSAPATAATFATVALPEMDRYKYDKRLSTGVIACVGTLGGLIPPSVGLIIYALLVNESIGKLFLAGILPGMLLALSFIGTLVLWCKRNPAIGPAGERSTWKARLASLPSVIWVVTIFLVVVGGLMAGLFTPTEAGSVGTGAVCLLSFLKKDLTIRQFWEAAKETLYISSMVILLLAGATILGHFFAVTRTPYAVADLLGGLHANRYLILTLILLIYIIGGEFIEDVAFMVLATPIFAPIVVQLGFDLVHFGIVMAATIAIGVVIPPMAMTVFMVSGIAKVPIGLVYKGVYPFLIGMSCCVFILMFFPQISMWLPSMFIK
jgi:C4-dicarboxylate transporter, DctM subunit